MPARPSVLHRADGLRGLILTIFGAVSKARCRGAFVHATCLRCHLPQAHFRGRERVGELDRRQISRHLEVVLDWISERECTLFLR